MKSLCLLPLLILLAACASPREACERNAIRDYATVSALIVETRQNIERGYSIEKETRVTPRLKLCVANKLDKNVGVSFCNDYIEREVDKPVAIDLEAEQAKLKSLLKKQAELAARARRDQAICAAEYPDS